MGSVARGLPSRHDRDPSRAGRHLTRVVPAALPARARAAHPRRLRGYRSTALRAPLRTPVDLPQRLTEVTGPVLGEDRCSREDADLTLRNGGEAVGQRILVFGRVLDSDGRPVPDALVEVWQANASGRYRHVVDTLPARWTRTSTGWAGWSPTAWAATSS